ncbi:hypothetical protein [Flavobacterium ajazii]|uniref:hypothetical protein n=1 Tax=Flavobacterium ajazii TaxID=2692318 RepID=UPI0013D3E4A1|nr:hypothetical protein [Flavobacterium ajazii]
MIYDIKLNFINKSTDTNKNNIVIFHKNFAEDFEGSAVAWKVINDCGRLDTNSFVYPADLEVSVSDFRGNSTPRIFAGEPQVYEMVRTASGNVLQVSPNRAEKFSQFEVRNNLGPGSVDVNCYKDGKLLMKKRNLLPGQKAVFGLRRLFYIGVIPQIKEGDVMSPAVVSQIKATINLFALKSADIVMSDGTSWDKPSDFRFELQNIKRY